MRVSRLVVIAVPPAYEEGTKGFLEPIRQLRPEPPEHGKEHSKGDKDSLDLGAGYEVNEELERCIEEQETKPKPKKDGEELQPNRNPGLRRREFPASALRANLRTARIHMRTGAEADIVGPAAGAAVRLVLFVLILLAPCLHNTAFGQALNMDGQSGIFFQPWAEVVPAPSHRFGVPTMSFHIVDAGPVAGDYLNVGIEEGFGNRIEFGFTRNNHTDGGDPTISPLFNFAGMNMFNVKAKLIPAGARKLKYVPAVSAAGVLRTNDPFVVQSVQHTNATNGDVYGVATELFAFGKKFAFLANAGVRGTNAQKYGYGGNTIDWEARAFAGLAFPIPIKKAILVAPTIEVDQEPRYIKYVPTAHLPTDLIYAVRVSRYPDSKWTFDVGTGHVGATLAQGINIKVNNAVAFAADFRF